MKGSNQSRKTLSESADHQPQVSNVDVSPTMPVVNQDEPGWDSTRLDPVIVKLRQNKIDQQVINQAKQPSRTSDHQYSGSSQSQHLTDNKASMRLRNSSAQFNLLADQLTKQQAMGLSDANNEVAMAMHEAAGYNIVSSKSTKLLPMTKNGEGTGTVKLKSGKTITQPINILGSSSVKMSESVKNIIAREQLRDEKLATRLKKINDKQAERIKEIESQEMRNQQNQLHKMVQRTNSFTDLSMVKQKGAKNDISTQNKQRTSLPNVTDHTGATQSQRQSVQGSYIIPKINEVDKDKQYLSNRKEYFSSQSQSSQILPGESKARNESFGTKRRNYEVNATTAHDHSMSQISIKSKTGNNQTFSAWQTGVGKNHVSGKDRPDVSFLQEKATMLYSQNASKKMALDASQNVLLSQSQLTSGNEGRDDYLQIALGLRQIGKSIMDMPKTLEDLRLLSREYMKNLGVTDDIQDEQVYLQYIEDHLHAQEKTTSHQSDSRMASHQTLSPIRNLADFYQRKLNKIQAQNEATNVSTSRSPRRKNVSATQNQTLVDIDRMTAVDIEKLEQSPPKINPRRKHIKVISNKAMIQFGPEAFSIRVDDQDAGVVRSQSKNLMPTTLSKAQSTHTFQVYEKDSQHTPNNKVRQVGRGSRPAQRGESHVKKQSETISRTADRRKLLNSLNDLADQLTRPSIAGEEKMPQWIQQNLKEEALKAGLSQSNLGKPSSRQDAILLAKWFKGIIDTIEQEFHKSKFQVQKSGQKRPFPTQKNHESEIQQTDTYLLIQIAHNIAIKEITRQVSVQCIERGILLKTIFDSYVRMVDLIFVDSFAQRKLLAQKFAAVCEKQVFYHGEQIRNKDSIIQEKDLEVATMRNDLEIARQREMEFKLTNKKLTQISHRSQNAEEDAKRQQLNLERQNKFLENRIAHLLDIFEPDKAKQKLIQKETNRALQKIEKQAIIDHDQAVNKKKQNLGGMEDHQNELAVIGEIIQTEHKETDMEEFKRYLEQENGGPLTFEQPMQTDLEMEDKSNDGFDLFKIGVIKNMGTAIDAQWRRDTRPKRIRPRSAEEKETKKLDKNLKMMDGASFDTSSHNTIDYLVETKSSKSYTFGQNKRYQHIRKQKPVRRSLSAGNFNWNLLVGRVEKRFEAEAKENMKLNTGHAMTKLTMILGESLLAKIKSEYAELYEHLMQHIRNKKQISYGFCRDLLAEFNLNLEEERQLQRLVHGNKFQQIIQGEAARNAEQNLLNDSNELSNGGDDATLNLTNISDVIAGGTRDTLAKAGGAKGSKKGKGNTGQKLDNMYQFVEWNFQKRKQQGQKVRERKDHPSNKIVDKILEKHSKGKEMKDLMPVKTAVRYIYNIYMGKAQEFAQEKQAAKKAKTQAQQSQKKQNNMNDSTDAQKKFSPRNSAAFNEAGTTSQNFGDNVDEGGKLRMSLPKGMSKQKSVQSPKVSVDKSVERQPDASSQNNKTVTTAGKMNQSDDTNLIEWTWEFFNNKYGLKNVADKKFQQFVGSLMKHKDKYPRFRLFARFLGLFEELSEHDLKLYVDLVHNMYKTVLNFQILEQDEVILIPTPRALDYFRLTFATRLSNASMSQCIKVIKGKQVAVQKSNSDKHLHLNSYNEAVQLDDFAEFTIHTTNQLQTEKLQNIQDLFMAADLDGNGLLLFNELKTLYKLLCNQHSGDYQMQMQEIRVLYFEYAEVQNVAKTNEVVKLKGISYDNFEKLCLEKDVFTIRQQNSFINAATKTFLNVTDSDETFNREFVKLNAQIDTIHLRLTEAIRQVMDSKSVSDSDKQRYQDMVEQMAKAVMNPENRKIAFLTFKIVEETIKRACLKVQIENLMPVDSDSLRLIKKALNDSTIQVDQQLTSGMTELQGVNGPSGGVDQQSSPNGEITGKFQKSRSGNIGAAASDNI